MVSFGLVLDVGGLPLTGTPVSFHDFALVTELHNVELYLMKKILKKSRK